MYEVISSKGEKLFVDQCGIHASDSKLESSKIDPKEIESARLFIDVFFIENERLFTVPKTKSESYAFKHMAESFVSFLIEKGLDEKKYAFYVSNGAFIVAAYEEGIPIVWDCSMGLNCFFKATFCEKMALSLQEISMKGGRLK